MNYFLNYLNQFIYNKNSFFINEYKKYVMFINSNINIKISEDKNIKGYLEAINDDGSLIIKNNDKRLFIYSGHIQNCKN